MVLQPQRHCNPTHHSPILFSAWRPEGEWLSQLDLVEQGSKLLVKDMQQVREGKCRLAYRAACASHAMWVVLHSLYRRAIVCLNR